MPNLATVTLIGHLGKDPEIRYLPDGAAVCSFSLATSEKTRDSELTTWWKISVWGRQADACNQYLAKGRAACVQGRVSLRPYVDREGNERHSLEVNAQSVVFLGNREDGGERESKPKDGLDGAREYGQRQQVRNTQLPKQIKVEEDEIPFR